MAQVSPLLRQTQSGYAHWCPGCERLHILPNDWTFNGDVERPTFSPSFLHRLGQEGPVCHYFVREGRIEYCGDSHHALAGQTVDIPPLPEWAREFA